MARTIRYFVRDVKSGEWGPMRECPGCGVDLTTGHRLAVQYTDGAFVAWQADELRGGRPRCHPVGGRHWPQDARCRECTRRLAEHELVRVVEEGV